MIQTCEGATQGVGWHIIVALRGCQFSHVNYTDRTWRPLVSRNAIRKRVDRNKEALSHGTCTDRGTVFSSFALWPWQVSHERCYASRMHQHAPGNKAGSRDTYFSRTQRLPWRAEKRGPSVNISTAPSPSTSKATLFFLFLSFFMTSSSRVISGR